MKALKDENNINLESKLKTQRSNCKAKLNKLIDLYVDGSIDKITFEKKQENLTEKLNGINSQIESLENINESEDEVKKNYEKIKKEMTARESSNELKEFDESLFRNLVDYVIVGSVDESGTPNGYIIRFIIKNGLYSKPKKIATDEAIITNGLDNESSNMYSVLLDFISTQKFITFETEENGTIFLYNNKRQTSICLPFIIICEWVFVNKEFNFKAFLLNGTFTMIIGSTTSSSTSAK